MTRFALQRMFTFVLLLLLSATLTPSLHAADNTGAPAKVVEFTGQGYIVVAHSFFAAAVPALSAEKEYQPPREPLSDRLFVTADGVYAFVESPTNKKLLEGVKPDTALSVKGKLLASGSLLLLDEAVPVKGAINIDQKKFRDDAGKLVALDGVSRCQCALDLGGLPTTCTLGHLHHLQMPDGSLYSYLPIGDGAAALAGKPAHNSKLHVEALLLPGRQLLVRSVERGK
jgi:hypothetical protein